MFNYFIHIYPSEICNKQLQQRENWLNSTQIPFKKTQLTVEIYVYVHLYFGQIQNRKKKEKGSAALVGSM